MKKLLYAVLILGAGACNGKSGETFTIDGTIRNGQVQMVYLEENSSTNPVIIDSAKVDRNGRFTIKTARGAPGTAVAGA